MFRKCLSFTILLLLINIILYSNENREVTVAYFESECNLEKDSNGDYHGYTVAFLNDISRFTGWTYKFVELSPAEAFEAIKNNSVDIMPMVTYSKDRSEIYAYPSIEYGIASLTLFVHEKNHITESDLTAKPIVVALAENTSNISDFEVYAKDRGITYSVLKCKTLSDVYEAVISGKADAGVLSNYQKPKKTRAISRFASNPYYFITSKTNKEIYEGLDFALKSITFANPNHASELFALYDKNKDNLVSLLKDELEIVKQYDHLHIAFAPLLSPLVSVDKNTKKVSGILPDILEMALNKVKISVDFEVVDEIGKVNQIGTKGVKSDAYVGFISSNASADRNNLLLSNSFFDASVMLITNPKVDGNENFYATTYIASDNFIPGVDGLEPLIFTSAEDCFEALKKGNVNRAFVNTYSASNLLLKSEYADFESLVLQDADVNMKLAFFDNTNPKLIAILNKALYSIKATEKNTIILENMNKDRKLGFQDYVYTHPITVIVICAVFFVLIIIAILYISGLRHRKLELAKNEELEKALELAKKANSAKSDFLSRMSHEIRTPLNAVIGYNAIAQNSLERGKDDAQRRQNYMKLMDCLIKSDIASKHLLTIINDVLDMSAIESGNIKIAHEKFDLRAMISSITTLFYNQAKSKKINFQVVLNKLTEEWFVGDQIRLNQIITNLLANALKFTPENGSVKLIIEELQITEKVTMMHFEVQDTGIGMDEEYLTHIWKPFEQADASIAKRFGGTGLGLSITKNLVNLLGGTINVESEKNVGSVFRVDVGLQRTEQPELSRVYNFASINALVVDDDESLCDYVKLLFTRCGARCVTATSGFEALKLIEKAEASNDKFTLFFIDWRMPELDGIETVRRLHKTFNTTTPTVIVTAYDYSEIKEEAESAGVDYFINKPVFQSTVFDLLVNVSSRKTDSIERAERAKKDEAYNFDGKRILLAEDNEMNMEIAKEILSNTGLKVDSAWNGKEAVALFESAPAGTYQLILMDVQMPEMDGYEATKAIRLLKTPEAQSIPIIAMTADAFAENVAESLAAGMNDHISKPIDIAILKKTLSKYIK